MVITAVTAQSTVEVRAIHSVPLERDRCAARHGARRLRSRRGEDGHAPAPAEIISTVVGVLARRGLRVVVDPVMIAESGATLLEPSAMRALVTELLPRAEVLTPNIPEAEALLGRKLGPLEDRVAAEDAVACPRRALRPRQGRPRGGSTDRRPRRCNGCGAHLRGRAIPTTSTHGTGCTYSAAIAALLARGASVVDAVERAHAYVHAAMAGRAASAQYSPGPRSGPPPSSLVSLARGNRDGAQESPRTRAQTWCPRSRTAPTAA